MIWAQHLFVWSCFLQLANDLGTTLDLAMLHSSALSSGARASCARLPIVLLVIIAFRKILKAFRKGLVLGHTNARIINRDGADQG